MVENTDIPCPSKIRSFRGMVGFYQQFFEGYCIRVSVNPCSPCPLVCLSRDTLAGTESSLSAGNSRRQIGLLSARGAFETLKRALSNNALLSHPDFSKPFLLSVDASSKGLGAVLSQLTEGADVARPVAYASKSLNHAQSQYPAHRLEFLALKWAVCDKFSHWLRGQHFTVWTDNNPLTYILTKPKLEACEHRWVAKLAPYD